MKILKFGGTSVGSAKNIRQTLSILNDYISKEERIAVVVSAVSGMTNLLIEMSKLAADRDESYQQLLLKFEETHYNLVRELISAKNQSVVFADVKTKLNDLEDVLQGVFLINELSPKSLDFILSHGERINAFIIAHAALEQSMDAGFLDARKVIITNEAYGGAKIDFEITNELINKYFETNQSLQIITGFIASTPDGNTTTLGRGGSDYTAAVFAAALNATETEIWTDVDGVMTADPRIVKNSFSLPAISYAEAMELSHFGAKVIYPPTLQPVFTKRIPIRIRNTFNPEFPGTLITEKSGEATNLRVKGISSIREISLINVQGSGMIGVPGVSARLFGALARNKINLVLITQASSEHSICFAIDPEQTELAKVVIEEEFLYEMEARKIDPVVIKQDLSVVALIGENMMNTPGISGKMFHALGVNGINIVAIAQGSSELNISAVIERENISKALNALHESFFLSDKRTLNIFMVGPGLIGSTLISQIEDQAEFLFDKRGLKINLVALANSKKMIFDINGVNRENWREALKNGQDMSMDEYVEQMEMLNLPNSIFVDNTSNKMITEYYARILASSISVVTPNKIANSSSFEQYELLKETALRRGVKFLYETNVGAGLPVIGTLQGLIHSGDEIEKIEGVLSGSLSYIFNTYDGSKSFKDVVLQAKEAGFTEPDPRDDLSGMDVARKILILSREAGFELEIEDIHIENILPEDCLKASTVDEFFEALANNDDIFKNKLEEAKADNKKLCFIAAMEKGKVTVGLDAVDSSHPFYALSGSDNMISYTTKRYKANPLVIKGPGAGAEVTAAGVFADIISISNYLA